MLRRPARLVHHLLLLSMATGLAQAADKVTAIKVCTENEDSSPWLFKDRPGLSIIMMKMVEKQVGMTITVEPLPWKRCLADLEEGKVDGAFKISFKADRIKLGQYPLVGDKPDASKRMLDDSYSLYRQKGDKKIEWDGKALKVTEGSVGAQSGFSVVDQLKSMNVKVDDGSRVADDNLKKLVNGRVTAVALQTQEGDNSLAGVPEFKDKLEKMTPPLVEKPYFLIFSHQFYEKHTDVAKQVWDGIATVRESADYKKQMAQFK